MSATPVAPELWRTAIVIDPVGQHERTIVWLHGLGDQGSSYVQMFQQFKLQNTRIVLPTAPVRPVSVAGNRPMTAWYNLIQTGKREFGSNEDSEGIAAMAAILNQALDYEASLLNNQSEKIILGGFSQGCSISEHTAASYSRPLAAMIGSSGYLLGSKLDSSKYANSATPFYLFHGGADQVVPTEFGRNSRDFLLKLGFNVEFYEQPGLGHGVSPQTISKIAEIFAQLGF